MPADGLLLDQVLRQIAQPLQASATLLRRWGRDPSSERLDAHHRPHATRALAARASLLHNKSHLISGSDPESDRPGPDGSGFAKSGDVSATLRSTVRATIPCCRRHSETDGFPLDRA